MKSFKFIIVFLSILLLSSCTTQQYTMEQEVEMWNEATARTLDRYNTAKELSEKYSDMLYRLFVYNEYNEALEAIFEVKEHTETDTGIETAGAYEVSFLESKRIGEVVDSYDGYMLSFADSYRIPFTELPKRVEEFYRQYEGYSLEELANLDVETNLSTYRFYEPRVSLHKYFTALNSPTVMEIWKLEGKDGVPLTIRVLWADNKIIFVDRLT